MTTKFSQIVAAGAISGTDTVMGLQAGPTDVVYLMSDIKTFVGASYLPLAGGTMTGGIGFSTTNTLDIGTSATVLAPRTVYAGTSFIGPTGTFTTAVQIGGAAAGGNALAVTGASALAGQITNALGTITTSQPLSLTQTWNASGVTFTGIFENITSTASAAGSLLIDLQVGGASKFSVDKNGTVMVPAATSAGYFMGTGNGFYSRSAVSWVGQANGSDIFQVYGTSATAGAAGIQLGTTGAFSWGALNGASDLFLSRAAAATLQLGAADVASGAVAQTLIVQSNTGASTTGPDFIIGGSKGTTIGGNVIIQTAATTTRATALTITPAGALVGAATTDAGASSGSGALQIVGGASVAKRFWIPAITASAGLQTAVLCQSSGGEMIADSVACLASSERFKTILGDAEPGALAKIARVPVKRWQYTREPGSVFADNYYAEHIGPTAEQIEKIDKRLVGYDRDGKVRSISTDQLLALAIQAIQEQQIQIEELKAA